MLHFIKPQNLLKFRDTHQSLQLIVGKAPETITNPSPFFERKNPGSRSGGICDALQLGGCTSIGRQLHCGRRSRLGGGFLGCG